LKGFDTPAYLRRSNGESKYNTISTNEIITNISYDMSITNTLPEEEERQKIQHFVNNITDKPADKFMRHLADRGLSLK